MVLDIARYTRVEDALGRVRSSLRPGHRIETILTSESFGRVSAVDLLSPIAVPRFHTSHMDGFAVMSKDIRNATEVMPVAMRIVGEVRLGAETRRTMKRGEAVRVATGSRIPSGADTVVPSERVKQEGGRILVTSRQEPGRWVFKEGADVRRGERVLSKGQVIRAQQIGLLLGLGLTKVKVSTKTRVSVIATGSELTDASDPKPGKVRNSHSPYFLSIIEALGSIPIDMGIVKDDPRKVARTIGLALAQSDFVLTLGGTSVGRADVVGEALSSLGPDLMLHGIRMDRGRVTGIAIVRGKPVLMMPGPIQGAMNAFVVFGVQIINLLSGGGGRELKVSCKMRESWEARRRFPHFTKVLYVKLSSGVETEAQPLSGETESIKVLSDADGYVTVPENVTRIEKGSVIEVRLLPGFSFA